MTCQIQSVQPQPVRRTPLQVIAEHLSEILEVIAGDLCKPDITVRDRIALGSLFLEFAEMNSQAEFRLVSSCVQ